MKIQWFSYNTSIKEHTLQFHLSLINLSNENCNFHWLSYIIYMINCINMHDYYPKVHLNLLMSVQFLMTMTFYLFVMHSPDCRMRAIWVLILQESIHIILKLFSVHMLFIPKSWIKIEVNYSIIDSLIYTNRTVLCEGNSKNRV